LNHSPSEVPDKLSIDVFISFNNFREVDSGIIVCSWAKCNSHLCIPEPCPSLTPDFVIPMDALDIDVLDDDVGVEMDDVESLSYRRDRDFEEIFADHSEHESDNDEDEEPEELSDDASFTCPVCRKDFSGHRLRHLRSCHEHHPQSSADLRKFAILDVAEHIRFLNSSAGVCPLGCLETGKLYHASKLVYCPAPIDLMKPSSNHFNTVVFCPHRGCSYREESSEKRISIPDGIDISFFDAQLIAAAVRQGIIGGKLTSLLSAVHLSSLSSEKWSATVTELLRNANEFLEDFLIPQIDSILKLHHVKLCPSIDIRYLLRVLSHCGTATSTDSLTGLVIDLFTIFKGELLRTHEVSEGVYISLALIRLLKRGHQIEEFVADKGGVTKFLSFINPRYQSVAAARLRGMQKVSNLSFL
jgi:hypothetical protein